MDSQSAMSENFGLAQVFAPMTHKEPSLDSAPDSSLCTITIKRMEQDIKCIVYIFIP